MNANCAHFSHKQTVKVSSQLRVFFLALCLHATNGTLLLFFATNLNKFTNVYTNKPTTKAAAEQWMNDESNKLWDNKRANCMTAPNKRAAFAVSDLQKFIKFQLLSQTLLAAATKARLKCNHNNNNHNNLHIFEALICFANENANKECANNTRQTNQLNWTLKAAQR